MTKQPMPKKGPAKPTFGSTMQKMADHHKQALANALSAARTAPTRKP